MRGAVAQGLLFVNEVHLALLDGAPPARLPESEAGVESEASIQVRPIEQLIGFVASVAPTQIHFIFECKFERHEPFIF